MGLCSFFLGVGQSWLGFVAEEGIKDWAGGLEYYYSNCPMQVSSLPVNYVMRSLT